MEEINVCSNSTLCCNDFCDSSAFVDDVADDGCIEILEI